MARRKTERPKPQRSVRHAPIAPVRGVPRRWLILGAVLLAAAAAAWWWEATRPARLAAEGESVLDSNPQAAADLLEEAVSLKAGDYPEAQLLWTRALLRSGRMDEALGCFTLIDRPSGLRHAALLELADEAAGAGLPLLAKLALDAIPPGSPERANALRRLIDLHQRTDGAARALDAATELLQLEPANAQAWLAAAQAYEQQADPLAALDAYNSFLQSESGSSKQSEGLRAVVRLSVLLGDRERARSAHSELLASAAAQPEDRLSEIRLLRLEGNLDEAWTLANALPAPESEGIEAQELRGTIAFDRQDYETAETALRAVLARQPRNKQANYLLGQLLLRTGREQQAALFLEENRRLTALSRRLVQLQRGSDPELSEADRLTELAGIYEQLGQADLADRYHRAAAAAGQ